MDQRVAQLRTAIAIEEIASTYANMLRRVSWEEPAAEIHAVYDTLNLLAGKALAWQAALKEDKE